MARTAVDDIDLGILNLLRSNARLSLTSMSKKLHLSKSAVKYRVDRLIRTGVIKSFVTLVDSSVYGIELSVIFDLAVEPRMIEIVAKKLCSCPEIIRVYELTTSPELHVHGLFANNQKLEEFIRNKIYTLDGTRVIKTGLLMRRYKTELSLTI
jgi:DNA-binding Lrp family transcriptional regulator